MALVILVETTWIVENLQSVGGGSLFHLSYNLNQVSDSVREMLRQTNALQHVPVSIYQLTTPQQAVLVADGHLAEMVQIDSTLRLHIRLIHVCPFVARKELLWPNPSMRVDVA